MIRIVLKLYETRGVRLELDYLKAELGMRRLGIEHTIAIFGSAEYYLKM